MQPATPEVIETAVEAGLLIMRNGGSTVAADRTFTDIVTGYHQQPRRPGGSISSQRPPRSTTDQ